MLRRRCGRLKKMDTNVLVRMLIAAAGIECRGLKMENTKNK
jgi:hypothetical protein